MGSSGQIVSYLLSVAYIVFFFAVMGIVTLKVYRANSDVVDLGTAYPRYISLFATLKTTKGAQLSIVAFIFRRFLLGFVLIFIEKSQFQVYALVFITLAQIIYLAMIMPYDDPTTNLLGKRRV